MDRRITSLEEAYERASIPRPEVTDAELLAYMRAKLARKEGEYAKLGTEVKMLRLGIGKLERRMAEADKHPLPSE